MTNFEKFKVFFDQIEVGDFVTRSMMLDFFDKVDHTAMENIRCHMMRAGYFYDWKRTDSVYCSGIYYKTKELPENMNGNKLKKQAYPERTEVYYLNLMEEYEQWLELE